MSTASEASATSFADRVRLSPWALWVKKRAAALLCHPWIGRVIGRLYRERVPCRGLRIETPRERITRDTVAQIFWGIYESAEIRLLERHLRRDLDVLELGSSLGVVSSRIAQLLEPGRKLVCVEANPALAPLVRSNVERNAPGRRVDVVSAAIAYGTAEVDLVLGETHTASAVGEGAAEHDRVVRVPAMTLSELVERHRFEEYVLVCDIEGAEAEIFFRDAQALAGCRQIIIELHDTRFDGEPIGVERLRTELTDRLGFVTRASYGNVDVFERASSRGDAR